MSGHKSITSLQKHLISAYPNIISELDIHTGNYLSSKIDSHQNEMLILGILLSVLQQQGQVAMRVSDLIENTFVEHLEAITSKMIDLKDEIGESNYFLGSGNSLEKDESANKTELSDILRTKFSVEVLDGFVKSGIIGDVNQTNYITIEIEFPLVRQGNWIYLSRYWKAERTIVSGIKHRIIGLDLADAHQKANENNVAESANVESKLNPVRGDFSIVTTNSLSSTFEPEIYQRIHQYLFDRKGRTESQINAVITALRDRFTIITGGPGTGKTRCISTLLAALFEFNPSLKVAMAAPTGKAAARMMESVSQNLDALDVPDSILQVIPKSASTLHRLIGWNPGLGKAIYTKDRQLELDLLIIDEASMVDLAMLARVFKALPDTCRIILLGDKDQLSSVEAGAVFGEITKTIDGLQTNSRKSGNGFKTGAAGNPSEKGSKFDFMVSLDYSWRFSDQSKLSELATLINQGDDANSWQLMKNEGSLSVINPKQTNLVDTVIPRIHDVHNQLLDQIEKFTKREDNLESAEMTAQFSASTNKFTKREHGNIDKVEDAEETVSLVTELFKILKSYQILSAHRRGFGGSMMINTIIDKVLSEKLRINGNKSHISDDGTWYVGRPVIVTQNDYNLGLFNGDIGITIKLNNRLMVSFGMDSKTNRLKIVAPSQLYNIESAWVITVHKSQGSEFENIMVVLPDEISPVLTRELIYTAVTRARDRVEIYGHESVWNEAVRKQSGRFSGIGEMLTQLLDA